MSAYLQRKRVSIDKKIASVHSMKVFGGGGIISPLILNFRTRKRLGINLRQGPFTPGEKILVCIE
jgi:hypothetical protein